MIEHLACQAVRRHSMSLRMIAIAAVFLWVLCARSWGQAPAPAWLILPVPGAWPTNRTETGPSSDGFGWYRAWLKPHDSFFTPHERNLFAESVTFNVRDLADTHEVFVNGSRIGGSGQFPPDFRSGRSGNHRYKIPPGLLKKGEWNEIAIRVYHAPGAGGFLSEAPFVMDYFNECRMEGVWEWLPGDGPGRTGGTMNGKPARAAFDRYHESSGILGEAAEFVPGPRLPPAESLSRLKPSDDLEVDLLLSEPLVAQPTHLSFDARGRLWVAQYRQYPYPAGVKMLSRDKYYRAQYDRVPPPPPNHTPGRDLISIHEDTDGDGVFDRHTVFVSGLNMANAALPGRGGVWVMQTPYLLFYPDRDGDDVPDGPPEVHLSGFGLEDTHSVANGLVWGPDGWIYGAQGSTTSSRVVRPGIDPPGAEGIYFEGCMVWRYHPVSHVYELFAEGSGNVFGLEFDGEGRLFSGHNGSETRGWHYQQGGIYLKQGIDPGKFGPPRNPYAFGELPWMKPAAPIQRFTHMVAVVEGTAMPRERAGQMFWLDPIHSLVVASERPVLGSTFGTRDLGTVLSSGDDGFRPVYVVNAPDGSLYVADFYEHYIAHGQHYQSQIDPTTGRVYRLRGRNSNRERNIDLSRRSHGELMELLTHSNKWHRQMAVRLLGERATAADVTLLRGRLAASNAPVQILWVLGQAGALDVATARVGLAHPNPLIREWTVRLLGDSRDMTPELSRDLAALLLREPEVRVRAQAAATARRLPPVQGLSVVRALLERDADAEDPCVPLLCWWVLEKNLATARAEVLTLLDSKAMWEGRMLQEQILPRLMRRLATEGRRQDLLDCARLLSQAPTSSSAAALLKGFEEAYRGRALADLPEELVQAMSRSGSVPLALRLRQGDAAAIAGALQQIQDPKTTVEDRLGLIRTLGEIRESRAVSVLLTLAEGDPSPAVRRAALAALAGFEDEALGVRVVKALKSMPPDVRASALALLVNRKSWSLALLESIGSGTTDREWLTPELSDRLLHDRDPQVRDRAQQWVGTTADPGTASRRTTAQVESILNQKPGNPYAGEPLFQQRCAGCHRLFFKGGNIGPDLTAYQRDNLGTLLPSILTPSAEIREGYAYVDVTTTDGRTLGGFLADRDTQVTVVRGLDGQDVVLRASEIRSVEPTGRSLMPEGLLDDLNEDQVRDFFAFLRSSQPFTR